ncbi:MAG: ferritin [Acidobacteria bacterium]|nr:MAG: ferritin [Acidobacteriota bacterium]
MAIDKANLATVEKMWRREVEAATTYRHLANRERDSKRRDILLRLAEQEDKHAARWSERIADTTGRTPDRKEVEHGLSWFQRISDPSVVLHRLEQEENRAEAEYDQLMARLSDPTDRRIAEEAMLEERDHAVVLRTLAGGKIPTPRSTLESILGRERWHVRGTGWIGDAIYGVNDGLGAVFGIVSGMAGYTGGSEVVLAAGLAGTLASALSMGAGAYLSSKSQREVYESEVAREQAEIEEDPHEEMLELELFYQLKGFSADESRAMAERLQKEPKQFLRTLVHEELGLSEETFPNPWRSTISASVSTALVTMRPWWATGLEMTAVGVIEAAVTCGLGLAFASH